MSDKAIIFDLDGTLVHTRPEYRYLVLGRVMKELKVNASKEDIDKLWFGTNRNKIVKERFDVEAGLFWEEYRKKDTEDLRKNFIEKYEDVGFLKKLKKEGYKIGVVTGAPEHIVKLEMELLKVNFDAVVIANPENGVRPKPDPHGLKKCLELLEVDSGKAVFVGNAEEDILAAKEAGVLDVFIDRKEHDLEVEASIKIESLPDLKKHL